MRAVSRCLFSDRLRTALLDFATRIVRSIDTSISCTLSAFVPSALRARSPDPGAANTIFLYTERRRGRVGVETDIHHPMRARALSHTHQSCVGLRHPGRQTANALRTALAPRHGAPHTRSPPPHRRGVDSRLQRGQECPVCRRGRRGRPRACGHQRQLRCVLSPVHAWQ